MVDKPERDPGVGIDGGDEEPPRYHGRLDSVILMSIIFSLAWPGVPFVV